MHGNATPHAGSGFDVLVAMVSGIAGGTAYLLAQSAASAVVHGGTGFEPLQRTAAILLGPDFAPPPIEATTTVIGMGVFIHLVLSVFYGGLVDGLVRAVRTVHPLVLGALAGAGMYFAHRWVIAPVAFPWFDAMRGPATILGHCLFGLVAAACSVALRRGRA